MSRQLNASDVARLAKADERQTDRTRAVAMLLLEADGRREYYQLKPWDELPPMIRWMADELIDNTALADELTELLASG